MNFHKPVFLYILGLIIHIDVAKGQVEQKDYGISFSGFIKNDIFGDTRSTVNAREGHFLLWPVAPERSADGTNIHEYNRLNMLPIQSRLSASIKGPDAFGAKTSGVLETDFFGQANDNINLFRMRHAFVRLNWENTEILSGQYWNPLFITTCFPTTLSFNSGTPFNSFNRAPQIRITHKQNNITLVAAALTQRDYTSRGPEGASYTYLSNAVMPNLHAVISYTHTDTTHNYSLDFGVGGDTKQLVPRTHNSEGQKVSESVSSMSSIFFVKLSTKPITIKLQARYGENNTDLTAPSGFAVKDTTDGSSYTYTPLTNTSFWTDIHTNGTSWNVGLFAGLYKNNGSKDEIKQTGNPVYGLSQNIETLFRISPRISYKSGNFTLGAEVEYTGAYYGSDFNSFYVPQKTTFVANNRILFTTMYTF